MQSTSKLLLALSRQGVTVSLVGGKLKVEPRLLITDEVKKDIGRHKAEIIATLTDGMGCQSTPPSTPDSQGCFECSYYDGKGTGWPGMCRYFETIGKPTKEIDFNVVDPLSGCKCFLMRPVGLNEEIPCLMQGVSETLPSLKLVQAKESPTLDCPRCLICGLPLNQDGGDCWHKAFHLGGVFPLKGVNLKQP